MAGTLTSGSIVGQIPDGTLGLVGIRYHRLINPKTVSEARSHNGPIVIYTADVFPVVRLSLPSLVMEEPTLLGSDSVQMPPMTTYGFGVSPAGFRLNYRYPKRIQPFIASSAGLVYFGEAVPSNLGKRLNFTIDVGVGIRGTVTSHLTLTVGYRYHHLSNGFRGDINPGFDANLLFLGVTVVP